MKLADKKKEIQNKPIRMCTACRGRFFKKTLLRLARIKDAKDKTLTIKLDLDQKFMGRGMYICYSDDCFKKLKKSINKKKSFFGSISESLLEKIEGEIKAFEA